MENLSTDKEKTTEQKKIGNNDSNMGEEEPVQSPEKEEQPENMKCFLQQIVCRSQQVVYVIMNISDKLYEVYNRRKMV